MLNIKTNAMLWSPSEVLAYLKEDLGIQSDDGHKKKNGEKNTTVYGGFQTWPSTNDDFILVAENSEIHGPNPLFAIPLQHADVDLNMLSTKILSADYQALSHSKFISLSHSQLLIPDLGPDIHVAANYFLLFDSEARGFIRPMCLAYFTSDKNKLMSLSGLVLKELSEAASILQHTNILHNIQDLKTLMNDIRCAQNVKKADEKSVHNHARESVLEDIQDVLTTLEEYEKNCLYEEQISNIYENLQIMPLSEEIRNYFFTPASSPPQNSNCTKSHHFYKHKKCMKDLYHICDKGLLLGLYHLFIVYKHFRRKYENVILSECLPSLNGEGENLYFGACLKPIKWLPASKTTIETCAFNSNKIPETICLENENYFCSLNSTFQSVLLDFINREKHFLETSENSILSKLSSCELSDSSNDLKNSISSSIGSTGVQIEVDACTRKQVECKHVVTLDKIWDILDTLEMENPGAEMALMEILKLFDDTQRLLFCVLTRVPVVLLSTPEELLTAQKFIKALSVFIPRRKDEALYVDIDRREPLTTEHFKNIAAVNICLRDCTVLSDFIPLELLQSLCILNLKDSSLTAPEYMGVLLDGIDERLRMLSLDGPAFPVIVDVILEVQKTVDWWRIVISSVVDASTASSSLLSRDFSRFDVQILMKLTSLSKQECIECTTS